MPKKDTKKSTKDVKKAMQKEADSAEVLKSTQEWLADVAADIISSPLADGYKAMFLYSIAQGTFDEDMHNRFIELLGDYRQGLLDEAKGLEQEIAEIDKEYAGIKKELSVAAVGACKEIAAAGEHIVVKATEEVERRGEAVKKEEVVEIKKKLKKNPSASSGPSENKSK